MEGWVKPQPGWVRNQQVLDPGPVTWRSAALPTDAEVTWSIQWLLFLSHGWKLVHESHENDHLEHLRTTFQNIREASLKVKLLKCALFNRYLQYVGQLVSGECIYPLKEKVATIVNFAPLTDVTETRDKIGLVSYYRKFVASFSDIVKSLTELTKKYTTFEWSPLCQLSFNTIKAALTKSPILIFPDPNVPYILFTDASMHSWSGVLAQEWMLTMKGKDIKSFLPIMCTSRILLGSCEN